MSAAETTNWLRPSMLPKLAQCGHYRPDENAGEAAERGTKLDTVFRLLLQNKNVSVADLTSDEREAVVWAVETARALSGNWPIEAAEEELRIECEGLTGTADALCDGAQWSADLKTGQIRNYAEQQAAYALGFMDRFFLDEWTVYLLFCDQREVVTLRFTRDEATRLVRDVLARAHDSTPPTPNEYCGWCAKRWECPARREALGIVPFDGPGALKLEDQPSDKLREFALRAKVVEDFAEQAREILKARCIAGEKISGVSLTSRAGTVKVPPGIVERHMKELGTGDVLAAYGSLSASKFSEIWKKKCGDRPLPEADFEQMPGTTFVRVGRVKESK